MFALQVTVVAVASGGTLLALFAWNGAGWKVLHGTNAYKWIFRTGTRFRAPKPKGLYDSAWG